MGVVFLWIDELHWEAVSLRSNFWINIHIVIFYARRVNRSRIQLRSKF